MTIKTHSSISMFTALTHTDAAPDT